MCYKHMRHISKQVDIEICILCRNHQILLCLEIVLKYDVPQGTNHYYYKQTYRSRFIPKGVTDIPPDADVSPNRLCFIELFYHFSTLIPLSEVGTICFSSCCDKDSAFIFMTGRLPYVNPS
jgi:hypothetical protein